MLIDHILRGITLEEGERIRTSPLRMSSSGHCARQIAYQLHEYEAEPLSSRAIMVFRLGDTIETEIKELIKKYYRGKIEFKSDPLVVEIEGQKIYGHIDGLIGEYQNTMILEIKSINGTRFKFLDRDGIPDDYRRQATAYMKAMNINKTLFVFYCKDTSHLKEMVFEYDERLWEEVKERFASVIRSTKGDLPDREYHPNDHGKLPWQCSYCAYNKHCYPTAVVTFDSKNKPQVIVKETHAS